DGDGASITRGTSGVPATQAAVNTETLSVPPNTGTVGICQLGGRAPSEDQFLRGSRCVFDVRTWRAGVKRSGNRLPRPHPRVLPPPSAIPLANGANRG